MSFISPENSVSIIRGASKTFLLSVKDMDGKVVDLTGGRVIFSVKRSVAEINPLIQKTSDNVAQIEITEPRAGKARIKFVPSDTLTMDPGEYVFDTWIINATGERFPVIKPSMFIVIPGVTVIPL